MLFRTVRFAPALLLALAAAACGRGNATAGGNSSQNTPSTPAPTAPGSSGPAPSPPVVTPPATGAPPATTPPDNTAPAPVNANNEVNFGKPDPVVVIDPNARKGFDASQIYAEDNNGYPGCEDPPQVDFGYNAPTPDCPATPIGTLLPMQSHCHINYNVPVTYYQTNPPASGDHWPEPSHSLGVNTVPVPREYYVHSMEHGAVILAYNCPNGCAYEVGIMAKAVAARPDRALKVLMTPDSRMPPNSFAAISWNWLYLFAEPDLAKLICFIDQHNNHARENDKVL